MFKVLAFIVVIWLLVLITVGTMLILTEVIGKDDKDDNGSKHDS